jgi:hypothetical protein
MKKVEGDADVADTIQYNLEIASAQGYISPADEAILREQLSSINIESFGGDRQMYDSAKATLLNTINYLSEQYSTKIKSGLIDGNLPLAKDGSDSGFGAQKGIVSRTLMTGTIGFAAVLGVGLLTVAMLNKSSTEEAKA